jgi:KDO2-lipid IV(A) lauroyltransferase
VIDQYASPPMGVPARFFGVEVDTLAAVGPLAQRTGAAVVPVSTVRDAEGIVHVRIEPELELGEALEDPAKVTQILASKVEAWIRATPEQWLWAHRRFKHVVWPEEYPTEPAGGGDSVQTEPSS